MTSAVNTNWCNIAALATPRHLEFLWEVIVCEKLCTRKNRVHYLHGGKQFWLHRKDSEKYKSKII